MMDAIKILIELESKILLDDDYDLAADLSRVKKFYKNATRDMSIEQQRAAREKNQALRFLYYRKRILQNYEEYSNYGKISEPVADSPLELMRETMKVNPFLSKRQKTQKANEVLGWKATHDLELMIKSSWEWEKKLKLIGTNFSKEKV
jgi:hypothetical protein